MISIKIGKKQFRGIYSWEEITLSKFNELASIPMPEGYEAYILADGKFSIDSLKEYTEEVSKITEEQINVKFPEYFKKVILCLSNVPAYLLEQIEKEEVELLYNLYFYPFVASLVYHKPVYYFCGQLIDYTPEPIKSFRVGFNRFYTPKSVNIMGQVIPLRNEPIITYSEASDLFRGMKIEKEDVNRLALFMAIYCRKRNEVYAEQTALERQELMMKVPMSIIWYVFFYTVRLLPDSSLIILLFGKLPKQIREAKDRVLAYKDLEVEALSTN